MVTATYFVDDYVLESNRSKESTATTLPDAVTGLKGTAYEDRVSLKWNKVKNADCYNVYLKENGKYVLKKTDFLKSEPWNMRLGPSLWKLFSSSLNDISSKELPYLLKRVSMLDINNFNFLMKEIFAKTKKGKLIMSKLSYKAKTDMDYDKFVDKMNKNRNNKNIITDEYIKSDEL